MAAGLRLLSLRVGHDVRQAKIETSAADPRSVGIVGRRLVPTEAVSRHFRESAEFQAKANT
jgi:hypothetical protein